MRRSDSWPLRRAPLWQRRWLQAAIWTASHPQYLLATLSGMLGALLFNYQLGRDSLANWDESIYGTVAKQMLARGDWLSPHANGVPWFDKPPLFMWLMAASYRMFGISAWSARLPSVLLGAWTLAVVVLIVHRCAGLRTAVLSGLLLPLMPLFLARARLADLDVALLAFSATALLAFIRANMQFDGWFGFWTGLAIMTKGAAGLIAPLIAGAFFLLSAMPPRLAMPSVKKGGFFRAVGVACLVALPWHLYQTVRMGWAFWSSYLVYHVLDRSTRPIEGHTGGLLDYPRFLLGDLKPLLPLLLAGFLLAGSRFWQQREGRFILAWFLTPLVLFSLVRTKIFWYVLPCYPALAAIAGIGADRLLSHGERWAHHGRLRQLTLLGLGVAFLALCYHHLRRDIGHDWSSGPQKRLCLEANTLLKPNAPLYLLVPTRVVDDPTWYLSHVDPHITIPYAPAILYYCDHPVKYLLTPGQRQAFIAHGHGLVMMDAADQAVLARHPGSLEILDEARIHYPRSIDRDPQMPMKWALVRYHAS